MSETKTNLYDKMPDYIESVFNVFQQINKRSEKQQDRRLKMICLMIFNYVRKLSIDYNFDLKNIVEPECINLIPIFEYISFNNIELYDFAKIDVSDLDASKNEDLERFILTHIYYLTQQKI
jgi:hypothetical protein